MADYQRVRDWIEKNVDPKKFTTLEDFIDKLETLPGVKDKDGVISDYKRDYDNKYAFKDQKELKQFKEDQKKALAELEKAENTENQLEALKKLQSDLADKIKKLESQNIIPESKPKVEKVKVEPKGVTGFVGKVGRFVKNLFGRK